MTSFTTMGKTVRHPQTGRWAFTLVELLVVLAIIATLMAVLLGSLANARRSARLAVCSAHLRELGTATRLYADTSDQFLPRRGQGVQPTQQIDRPTDWFNALPLVMGLPSYSALAAAGRVPRPGEDSVLSCPEASDSGQPNFWSYGMNMWLSVWNNGTPDLPNRFDAVGEPSTLVLLADGPPEYCSVSPASSAVDYSPVPRHSGRVNIVFLDGHVEAFLGTYVGCGIGFVEHADIHWQVPGSTWSSAQH